VARTLQSILDEDGILRCRQEQYLSDLVEYMAKAFLGRTKSNHHLDLIEDCMNEMNIYNDYIAESKGWCSKS